MMRIKETHVFAFWTFLYVGIEVTISGRVSPFDIKSKLTREEGWINTFLIDYRGGSPKTSGYAVTGFWTGASNSSNVDRAECPLGFVVGRMAFLWINRKVRIHTF
jgi:fucose permease